MTSKKINCIVRELSPSFSNSIKQNEPTEPINLDLAKKQHNDYTELLKKLCDHADIISYDDKCPDCCFIEDTIMCFDDTIVLCNPGADSRKPEISEVEKFIKEKYNDRLIYQIESPGCLDGGDVLFTGRDIFIGDSKRTNTEAILQLDNLFKNKYTVYSIPVQSLHLKSVISHLNEKILIVSDCELGHSVKNKIERMVPGKYEFIFVPDQTTSNILSINDNIIIQDRFPNSEKVFNELAEKYNLIVHKLNMSEFIKADGALTCCSVFIKN
jgi:dimethylargininase